MVNLLLSIMPMSEWKDGREHRVPVETDALHEQ